MTDLSLEWHDDFVPDATGDLLLVDGNDEVRQRLERRLFTAMQGYVWHPEYGAGLPQKIGEAMRVSSIRAVVMSQINLEASVAKSPAPKVSVTADPNNLAQVNIAIQYTEAATGISVFFTITA